MIRNEILPESLTQEIPESTSELSLAETGCYLHRSAGR